MCTTPTHALTRAKTEMFSCTNLYTAMFSHITHSKTHPGQYPLMHLQGHTDRCVYTHTQTHTTPLNNVLFFLHSLSSVSFYSATSHTFSSSLPHFVLNFSSLLFRPPFSDLSGLPVMWLFCFCWIKHRLGEREKEGDEENSRQQRGRKKERSREWKKQTETSKSRDFFSLPLLCSKINKTAHLAIRHKNMPQPCQMRSCHVQ